MFTNTLKRLILVVLFILILIALYSLWYYVLKENSVFKATWAGTWKKSINEILTLGIMLSAIVIIYYPITWTVKSIWFNSKD